jgi:hypothetical protein
VSGGLALIDNRKDALPDEYDPDVCSFGMTLVDDVVHCLRQEDTGFWRRTLVRTVFAYVEAHATIFRRMILEMYARNEHPRIPITKIVLLQDYEYQIDEVGRVKRQALKLVTLKQIALTLRTLAEVMGKDDRYISHHMFGVNDWRNLKESMKVRDRLTHPKKFTDLIVTDEEKKRCVGAFHWLGGITNELLGETPLPLVDGAIKYFYEEDGQGMWIKLPRG